MVNKKFFINIYKIFLKKNFFTLEYVYNFNNKINFKKHKLI